MDADFLHWLGHVLWIFKNRKLVSRNLKRLDNNHLTSVKSNDLLLFRPGAKCPFKLKKIRDKHPSSLILLQRCNVAVFIKKRKQFS